MSAAPLFVLSRAMLAVLLIVAWLAPAASASETTCAEIETGWRCTVWVNTFGEGPSFTFEITEDQTPFTAITFTSMTCDDWDNAPHAYAADPHLWLYSVTEENGEDILTSVANDDDSASHNDGSNMCWDAYLTLTLDAGTYLLRADA